MLDLLALMPHPDDAELLCGGTLAKAARAGRQVGVLDLTGGEAGSYGSRGVRATEALRAAQILGLALRENAGLPDAALENTPDTRLIVAGFLRRLRPATIILPWLEGRHPDHRVGAQLGWDAAFVAGLRNAPLNGEPHRPRKVLYCLAYREDAPRPTFVVDISETMETKLEAIFAYDSQLSGKSSLGEIYGGGTRPIRDQILAHHAHYGSLIRRPYGEPFWTRETLEVADVTALEVASF
jgi:N-acetylglucosamine malate deacetylase 1